MLRPPRRSWHPERVVEGNINDSISMTAVPDSCEFTSNSMPRSTSSTISNDNPCTDHQYVSANDVNPMHQMATDTQDACPRFSNTDAASQSPCFKNHFEIQNRAMIKVFGVFGFLCLFGLTYETIQNLICYAIGQYSAEIMTEFALTDTIDLVAIPVLFLFGAAYIDAVFLDTYQNILFITLILSMSIWQCAVIMFKPVGRLFNVVESNETHHVSCDLNDTFFYGFHYIQHICRPVYTEASMIMLGIALKLWHSFVSDTWPENNPERSRVRTCNRSIPLRRKITLYIKRKFRRFTKSSCRFTNPEMVPLLLTNSSRQFPKGLFAAWVCFVITNLPYLGVCLYFAFKPTQHGQNNPDDSFYEKSVLWSFEIVFSLSFCIIYSCQKIRDKLIVCHSGRETGGSLWKLKGHEIMLLVCSNGVFCQCVFLCTAATGIA